MKTLLKISLLVLCVIACSPKVNFNQTAGNLRLEVDHTGKIIALEDVSKGTNYISNDDTSFLISCKKYVADSSSALLHPVSMKIVEQTNSGTKLELHCKGGIKLTVLIIPKKDYFRMELIGAEPVSEICQVTWGAYKTTMRGIVADCLGLNRSSDFTIGMFSLEPNTDTYEQNAAKYTKNGSSLQMIARDQTRGLFIRSDNFDKLRIAKPLPGITVIGSAVALLGSASGKANELALIEKVELGEGLPHPMFGGKWNKISKEAQKPTIWTYNYDQNNFDEYLKLSKEMGVRILCRNGGFSKNWGHFDIDPKMYPGGIDSIAAHSKKAKKEGVGLTLYTLTEFLKPMTEAEPYIAPVPDDRLQTWKPETKLIKGLSEKGIELELEKSDEVVAVLKDPSNKVIRVDNEFIELKTFNVIGNTIVAKDCERGAFNTKSSTHPIDSKVNLMYVSGYHNFYPGTLDLSTEVSNKLWSIFSKADLDLFITDGFESCDELGYGSYGRNMFMKTFYDSCAKNKKEPLFSGSTWTNYTWHTFSHFTWGEYDTERGFRGTQLDCRLAGQMQLRNNLMPYKLGQYYPETATVEDVEWLLALATGWDSGFDFQLDVTKMRKNPDYNKIIEVLKLWAVARAENAFTEQQKMAMRQTDVQYKLSRKANGGWDLKFNGFWNSNLLKVLPPSVMAAKAVNGGTGSVKPCSIDWSWTHNPGAYDEVGLSDDLVQKTGTNETFWTVNYPAYTESKKNWFPTNDRHFQFVIRLPKDAPCAVKNFKVSVNDKVLEIPVTLQPGQYLSIPHIIEWACVYNEKNEVVSEVFFRGNIPKVAKGKTAKVGFSYEPLDLKAKPEVIMNMRFQNGYFF